MSPFDFFPDRLSLHLSVLTLSLSLLRPSCLLLTFFLPSFCPLLSSPFSLSLFFHFTTSLTHSPRSSPFISPSFLASFGPSSLSPFPSFLVLSPSTLSFSFPSLSLPSPPLPPLASLFWHLISHRYSLTFGNPTEHYSYFLKP